jgi:exonuclease III
MNACRLLARALKSPEQVGGLSPPTITLCPQITVSSQNCNSLNISTSCDKQMKKLTAILTLCTDIIFLSDLRMSTKSNITDITNIIQCNNICNYDFRYNSSSNKRGVAILISRKLNYSVLFEYRDREENILALKVDFNGFIMWLIAIYGPNQNNFEFYTNLRSILDQNPRDVFPYLHRMCQVILTS